MAYALRYYKEFTHADGKVIRLEIHKKDSTTAAVEIGAVVQGLSLQIQGQQGDIDTPIVKTSLSMTFVDAGDIENGQKNGFWEEFYTPDSVLWKVLVKAKKAGETAFTTIWGGYVTPDSFSESLTYRGSVNIIARDNIGHMQDFPFDAEGDEDGMISLYDLVNTAWAKIESPMSLMWDGGHWMQCEGVNGYNTLMNVSAFEGMSWYEAVEKALYSYGGVMRYIGGNEVLVTTLRYMPTFGRNIDRLPRIEPTFITGATRELVPAVKRVEESVKYELEDVIQPLVKISDFNGNTDSVADSTGFTATTWELNNDESGKGWRNPQSEAPTYLNPASYELGEESWSFPFDNDERKSIPTAMMLLCNNRSGRAVYSRYINAYDCEVKIVFGGRYFTDDASSFVLLKQNQEYCKVVMFEYAVRVIADGITEYMQEDGSWGTAEHIFSISSSTHMGEVAIPMSFKQTGNILLEIDIVQVGVTSTLANHYIKIEAVTFANLSSKPLLESNTVNTNYQEGNNVVLSRDPEIGPAYNDVVLPGVIKNGIFRREGNRILPAYKWGWSGSTPQQMAVYNHLQLLAYYAKPNNLISGTIVNADVTDIACIYEWHHADHILVSGNLNLLKGHIEGAMLREYARYEYLWADVEGAGFPETEQASTTNVEGGASAGGSSSTYTNNTTVNIGSGGSGGTGASYLGDLQDVDTTGVVAQSVLYYNGTSWVDMSIRTLLNPYVKGDELNRLLDEINREIEQRALDSDLDTLARRVGVNELAIADNAGNIKKNFDAIGVLESNKADKATTLAGYGITDAYTTEVIDGKVTAINNALALKADTTALEALAVSVEDNTTNIRNLKDSVYTKDDLATYKAWWDDLMDLIVKDGSDIKIKTNLIVAGDQSTGGEGESVVSGITGIKLNGETYKDENSDGIIDLGTITGGLTSVSWSDVQGRPTAVSQFANDVGFVTSAALVGYATQSWVEGKGYITGIDKSMVASAVGSSGNAGKVLSSTGGDLGWISLPSSLPASDVYAWAKKSSLALADVPDLSSKYLSTAGGTISGGFGALTIKRTSVYASGIKYENNSGVLGYLGFNGSEPYFWDANQSNAKALIHSGNIGSYAPIYDASKAVTLAGHLHLGGYIYKGGYTVVDFSGNAPLFGYGSAGAGLPTWVCGNEINFTYGASRATAMYINASGNVTIGASDLAGTLPYAKLCIDGVLAMPRGDGQAVCGVLGFSESNLYLGYSNVSTYDTIILGKNIRLNPSNGNVGIGTTSPAYKLDVVGDISIAKGYSLRNGNHALIGRNSGDNVLINAGATERDSITYIYGTYIVLAPNRGATDALGISPTGAVTMSSTLTVSGLTTINGNLVVAGDISA